MSHPSSRACLAASRSRVHAASRVGSTPLARPLERPNLRLGPTHLLPRIAPTTSRSRSASSAAARSRRRVASASPPRVVVGAHPRHSPGFATRRACDRVGPRFVSPTAPFASAPSASRSPSLARVRFFENLSTSLRARAARSLALHLTRQSRNSSRARASASRSRRRSISRVLRRASSSPVRRRRGRRGRCVRIILPRRLRPRRRRVVDEARRFRASIARRLVSPPRTHPPRTTR